MIFEARITSATCGNRVFTIEAGSHLEATKQAQKSLVNGRLDYVKQLKGAAPIRVLFAPDDVDVSKFNDTVSADAPEPAALIPADTPKKKGRPRGRV